MKAMMNVSRLVRLYRADMDVLLMPGAEPIPVYHGTPGGQEACRCWRCGRLLTVLTVRVGRYGVHGEGLRPACDGCADGG